MRGAALEWCGPEGIRDIAGWLIARPWKQRGLRAVHGITAGLIAEKAICPEDVYVGQGGAVDVELDDGDEVISR